MSLVAGRYDQCYCLRLEPGAELRFWTEDPLYFLFRN